MLVICFQKYSFIFRYSSRRRHGVFLIVTATLRIDIDPSGGQAADSATIVEHELESESEWLPRRCF